MTDKQLRQAIINPTQILVSDGTEVESNLGYFNLGATGRDLLATATEADARTNLGLAIGTNVQAYDADLAAIAALTTTGLIDRTGNGTATTRTTGTTGLNVLAAADEATARTAIGAMANTAPAIITNANGTAYRWPNGLQICSFQSSSVSIASTAWGNLWFSGLITRTYPAAFNAVPLVTATTWFADSDGATTLAWCLTRTPTTTTANFYIISPVSGGGARPGYIAIGTYTP